MKVQKDVVVLVNVVIVVVVEVTKEEDLYDK